MRFKSVKKFVIFIAFLFLLTSSVIAQNVTEEIKLCNCEDNIAILNAAHQEAGGAGLIIMISRLGENETFEELNFRQLHNAKV